MTTTNEDSSKIDEFEIYRLNNCINHLKSSNIQINQYIKEELSNSKELLKMAEIKDLQLDIKENEFIIKKYQDLINNSIMEMKDKNLIEKIQSELKW
jgi:hypothetical protein